MLETSYFLEMPIVLECALLWIEQQVDFLLAEIKAKNMSARVNRITCTEVVLNLSKHIDKNSPTVEEKVETRTK